MEEDFIYDTKMLHRGRREVVDSGGGLTVVSPQWYERVRRAGGLRPVSELEVGGPVRGVGSSSASGALYVLLYDMY